MNLYEYQAKELFVRYRIPTPKGKVAASLEEARQAAIELGGRAVVKAQVLTGGRGKAGGVRLVGGPDEAQEAARAILGLKIKGLPVQEVLVEEAIEIQRELYLSLVLDRAKQRMAMIASSQGGVDIEEIASESPQKIVKAYLNPLLGWHDFQARGLAYALGLAGDSVRDFTRIARGIAQLSHECDATLVEINPLAQTPQGLVALDAKIALDDNALFRQGALANLGEGESLSTLEGEAKRLGLSYVELAGDIGCLVNGAGLAMATMDTLALYGGKPANFLDIGGGARAEVVEKALSLLLAEHRVQAVLVNIFGGITRCDEVAQGLLESLERLKPTVPIVVRLAGTNAQEGLAVLADSDVWTAPSLEEAAKLAVEIAQKEGR